MIRVKAVGSLGKTLGGDAFTFEEKSMPLSHIVRKIFKIGDDAGYAETLSDIIVAVNGAAVSGRLDDTILESGDEVTLIPISHGG